MEIKNIDDLKSIISDAVRRERKITFLIGSGVSLPNKGSNGLKGVSHFTKLLYDRFLDLYSTRQKKIEDFKNEFEEKGFQEKYSFIAELLGKTEVEEIYAKEILDLIGEDYEKLKDNYTTLNLVYEDDTFLDKWRLNEGLESLGKISQYFEPRKVKFLTSNFDPFLEIAFRKNSVNTESKAFHGDRNYHKTSRNPDPPLGIEHYHGIWTGETDHFELGDRKGNTLYISENYIKNVEHVFVIGFGGWEDSATDAIEKFLEDNISNNIVIHWCFYYNREDEIKEEEIFKKICKYYPKVQFYKKIDSNLLFPQLLKEIEEQILQSRINEYYNLRVEQFKGDYAEVKNNEILFKNVDYKSGLINRRTNDKSKDLLTFIQNEINKKELGLLILCSKFGLGKTTILKEIFSKIFQKYQSYVVYLNFAFIRLSEFQEDKITNLLLGEIDNVLFRNKKTVKPLRTKIYVDGIIRDYLEKRKLTIILDGIDESIHNQNDLLNLKEYIRNASFKLLASVRLEFHNFFDIFSDINFPHLAIELKDWNKSQIKKYFDLKEDKGLNKNKILKKLKDTYTKTQVSRPIFLDMQTKLALHREKFISVKNISELYFNYINYIIAKQVNNLDFALNEKQQEILKREYLELLNQIAISIYLEAQKYKVKSGGEISTSISFSLDNLRFLKARFKSLDLEILKVLLNQKNGIIRSIKENEYTFFHRSYFEYLVAYGAASRIFEFQECSFAWEVYQTDEVSDYFVGEVERIKSTIDFKKFKSSMTIAFKKEFEGLKNYQIIKDQNSSGYSLPNNLHKINLEKKHIKLIDYSEKFEEVIYYVGKFKDYLEGEIEFFKSNIEKIFSYKNLFDPIYFRTCAITLSRLKGNEYIYNYLSRIIYDYSTNQREYFNTQIKKDESYYGKEQLTLKCHEALKGVLENKLKDEIQLNPLSILKIFSLFVSIELNDKNDLNTRKKLLSELQKHSRKYKWTKMLLLIEGLDFILNHKSLSFKINNFITSKKFSQKLIDAFKSKLNLLKRIDSNFIRLINSYGDGFEGLFIDYYDKHVIIEITNVCYLENIKLIEEHIKSTISGLQSISIKYIDGFKLNSRENNVVFKTIFGEAPSYIKCYEAGLKIIVNPNMLKTGFFIDNRKIRKYIASNSSGKKVLNLCSYTCTLGAIARLNGATQVVNVEKEELYINLGKEIYELNEIPFEEKEFVNNSLQNYTKNVMNTKFDLIILDLPEFSTIPCNFESVGKFYYSTNTAAINLLSENGILITTCCSHGFKRSHHKAIIRKICQESNLHELSGFKLDQLEDHKVNKNISKSDYLKAYVLQRRNKL